MAGEVQLRDVLPEDVMIFYEHQCDPKAAEMAAHTGREQDAFLAHWNRILVDDAVIKQTILYEGLVAGNIVSFEQSGDREVGYWIGRQFWGKGIASRALAAFLQHVKDRPLYAHVAKHNVASRRVLEKCGFVLAGEDRWQPEGGKEVEEYILILT